MAYSEDFRFKVMVYLDEGHTQVEACAIFKVSWATVSKWRRRYKETGEIKDKPPLRKPRTPKLLNLPELKIYVEAHPDATLVEIGKAHGCSDSTVLRGLRRLGLKHNSQLKLEYEKLRAFVEAHPLASYREIGKVFKCSEGAVARAFKRYGIMREQTVKKLDTKSLTKYIENNPHVTHKEITDVFSYSETSIRTAFKKLGIEYDFVNKAWKVGGKC